MTRRFTSNLLQEKQDFRDGQPVRIRRLSRIFNGFLRIAPDDGCLDSAIWIAVSRRGCDTIRRFGEGRLKADTTRADVRLKADTTSA
jgi:hypothetical protein